MWENSPRENSLYIELYISESYRFKIIMAYSTASVEICNSFHLRGGSAYLVSGSSGSGKSTTVAHLVEEWEKVTGGKEVFKDVHIW